MDFETKQVPALDLYDMRLKVTPAIYQRGEVWTTEKRRYLIDSMQRGIDIPKLYFFKDNDDTFEIVDGNQRFRSIVDFFEDGFPTVREAVVFSALPREERRKLEKYEFTIVFITNAPEQDLADLFLRLQLGVPTNTGEKLNAILCPMRDFVNDLARMPFIQNVSIPRRRLAREVVCACICLNSLAPFVKKGFQDTRYEDLRDMYKSKHDFNRNSPEGQRIVSTLTELDRIFGLDAVKIRNRASIISIYFLVEELIYKGTLDRKAVHDFYIAFLEELTRQVDAGLDATNRTLISYYNKVVGGADVKGTIKARHELLLYLYEIWRKTGKIGS